MIEGYINPMYKANIVILLDIKIDLLSQFLNIP